MDYYFILFCIINFFYNFIDTGHWRRVIYCSFGLLDKIRVINCKLGVKLDMLSAIMLFVVMLVSSLVHLYSIGYMEHDEHKPRFFSYLSLFTFAMLMLVTSNNLYNYFLAGKVLDYVLICS